MATWRKVVTLALTWNLVFIPLQSHFVLAQEVKNENALYSETTIVVPNGELATSEELEKISGEGWKEIIREVGMGAALGIGAGYMARRSGMSIWDSVKVGFLTFIGYLAGVWPRYRTRLYTVPWGWRYPYDPDELRPY